MIKTTLVENEAPGCQIGWKYGRNHVSLKIIILIIIILKLVGLLPHNTHISRKCYQVVREPLQIRT